MKFNIFKRAFSLTELLIVMVVVAVLFSALVPIMTKRRSGMSNATEPVWQYVNADEDRDAYFDKDDPKISNAAYIGLAPNDITTNSEHNSKVFVRANPLQSMIQFRYGNGNGILTGLFAADDKKNLLMTGRLTNIESSNYNPILKNNSTSQNNTVWGPGAFAKIKKAKNITAIGANAVTGDSSNEDIEGRGNVVAIGANAMKFAHGNNNIFIGANVGQASTPAQPGATVAVGSGSLGLPMSTSVNSVLLGYNVGAIGDFGYTSGSDNFGENTIVGSQYIGGHDETKGTHAVHNTIIGRGTYEGDGNLGAHDMTVLGYGACDASNGSPAYHTCIGYNSAVNYGHPYNDADNNTENLGWNDDNQEHIFLGGSPQFGLGGRAVLEVHNLPAEYAKSPGGAMPSLAPTVVMNSNLVVRGNFYFPSADDGVLRYHDTYILQNEGTETGADRCGPKCANLNFNYDFYAKDKCAGAKKFFKKWGVLIAVLVVSAVMSAITFGSSSLLTIQAVLTSNIWLGSSLSYAAAFAVTNVLLVTVPVLLAGALSAGLIYGITDSPELDKYMRFLDPVSTTGINLIYSDQCAEAEKSYPVANGNCPNLQLSDLRLKENLSENSDAISKILLIEPYNYTFKSDKDAKPQVGVIAQDLKVYFPNSVSEGKDGYLKIRWDEMFFATVNAVKSLDKIVSDLTNELDDLDKNTNQVAKNQKDIQKRIKELDKRINKIEK